MSRPPPSSPPSPPDPPRSHSSLCRPSVLHRNPIMCSLLFSSILASFLFLTVPYWRTCPHPTCPPLSSLPPLDPFNPSPPIPLYTPPFTPPPLIPSCLCSTSYSMSSYPASTWTLLPHRTYADVDGCPMFVPRSALLHQGPPIPGPDPDNRSEPLWQAPPCMAFDVWAGGGQGQGARRGTSYTAPLYSLQYTVFNQETNVVANLHAMIALANPREPFEVVVVFDDCSDLTIPLAHAYLHRILSGCGVMGGVMEDIPFFSTTNVTLPPRYDFTRSSSCINPGLVHVRTLIQPTGVWETAANNLGARAASPVASYLVFVQDDHIIEGKDWNSVMALPLRVWPADSIIGVSGRCGESKWSRARIELGAGWVGRCNVEIGEPLDWEAERRCIFYIRDSVNRGPLLISHMALRQLGYFDEVHFYMDDSDHDLFARAYYQMGAVVGVIAFDFRAPYDQGGSRNPNKPPRTHAAESYIKARKERASRTASALSLIYNNYSQIWIPHDENRPLPGSVLHRCVEYYRSGGKNQSHWYDASQLSKVGRGWGGGQLQNTAMLLPSSLKRY